MDIISSFFQNVKDKLANPFFGTLIFILIFHHWKFWYVILNFDKGVNLRQKKEYLMWAAQNEFSICNLLCDLFWAAIFTIVGYGIVVGTRALSLWIEFNIMEKITKSVTEDKIISRELYNKVVDERNEYSEKYEEQRERVRKMSKNYDEQTVQIGEKDKQLLERNTTISTQQSSITSLEKELKLERDKITGLNIENANLKAQVKKLTDTNFNLSNAVNFIVTQRDRYKNLYTDQQSKEHFLSVSQFPKQIREKVELLDNEGKWGVFKNVASSIKSGGHVGFDSITSMNNFGLVEFNQDNSEILTPIGEIIYEYIDIFE